MTMPRLGWAPLPSLPAFLRAPRQGGHRLRWRRFCQATAVTASLRLWLPLILGSTLVSGLMLTVSARQSERARHELIRRYAIERLDYLANDLAVETRDWSVWDESYLHVTSRYQDYYEKGNYTRSTFLRIPFVMVLDRRGNPISTAYWNSASQSIQPLSPALTQELLQVIPQRDQLQPRTFLAMFRGKPYLMSAQPIQDPRRESAPVGRLVFVRSLAGPDFTIARQALALQHAQFEPVRPLRSPALGPLAIAVRHPRWDGLQPLQITVVRPASERLAALRAFALLLGLNVALLAFLLLRAYGHQRGQRRQGCLQRREQQRLRRALHRRENLDALTGLLNEHGLLAAMEKQRLRYPDRSRALLLIDIKHFSLINNSFGRTFGDQVLIRFGQWLKQALPNTTLISRTGGDVFTCSLVGSSSLALRAEITRITSALQQLDLQVHDQTLRLSVAAGARLLTDVSPEKALHETGVARDLAKLSGRSQCQFYGDEQKTMQNYIAIQRLNQDLITALKENRIALFAQAAWHLHRPEMPAVYVEFLSRMHHPITQKYQWSEALVEAATYCGTMPLLDSHVLDLALHSLRQLFSQHREHAAIHQMVYAINITPDTLLADDFVPTVQRLLEREQLDPARLCLEITEQAAMRNRELVKSVMQRLRRVGLRFSLDDFGAGMTSLSHLRDLPLDYVKIDKAFIWTMKEESASRLTVEFVVRMGRELGFDVIAEGVETLDLLEVLRALGVTIAQGYLTAIPSLFDPLAAEASFARSGHERLAAAEPVGSV